MSNTVRSSAELAAFEIRDLHAFFQSWFRGEVPRTEAVFSRVAAVWGPSFELIAPNGRLRERGELLRTTFEEYGSDPGLSIGIRNLVVHEIASGAVVTARYEEGTGMAERWRQGCVPRRFSGRILARRR